MGAAGGEIQSPYAAAKKSISGNENSLRCNIETDASWGVAWGVDHLEPQRADLNDLSFFQQMIGLDRRDEKKKEEGRQIRAFLRFLHPRGEHRGELPSSPSRYGRLRYGPSGSG